MKTFSFILVFIATAMLLNYSCKKDESNPEETKQDTTKVINNQSTAKNALVATSIYNDVITDVVMSCDTAIATNKTSCPSISLTPSGLANYPKTLTIDFGTSCTFRNHIYSGSISASLSGKIRDIGTTVSISFNNFKVDTVSVGGTISLTVNDFSALNYQITLTEAINNGVLTFPSGGITLNTTQTVKWTINTLTDYSDDIFEVLDGNSSATGTDGKTFTSEVKETVVIITSCTKPEPVDGKMDITSPEYNYPATIDFGDGTCDGKAIVTTKISITVNNQTFTQDYNYEVILP
ncbi:MAG: hypothetical protein A2033_09180 [Bacteroidetes bacterium GWA2_31_9]|nr:MAG: hypothetical protein A2033_09180 [Bacteroidetes bacterium GWA2_31_9]